MILVRKVSSLSGSAVKALARSVARLAGLWATAATPGAWLKGCRSDGEIMRSAGLVALVGLLLSGCGDDASRELQPRADVLNAQSAAASRACDDTNPAGNPKAALARAKCQVEAAAIRRPIVRYPDLLDAYIATRLSVAEQVQAGKITAVRASDIVASRISKLVLEEKRRNRAGQPSSDDQTESIVFASPHSCTRVANGGECL